MSKKFISFLLCIFVFMFTIAGCSRVSSNKASEPVSSSNVSEKSGQSLNNTDSTTDAHKAELKDNEDSPREGDGTVEDKVTEDKSSENKETDNTSKNTDEDNKKNDNEDKNSNSSEKDQVKKNNKVVVIDAGHGGKISSEKERVSPDSNVMKPKNVSGATGIKTRTPEHVIALSVSMKLKERLEKEGYTVIMTRTTASQTISNIERAEIGNKNKADLVIRVHADSSTSSSAKGASMLIPGEVGYAKDIYKVSKQYGETIFQTLINDVKMKSRGIVVRKDLTGFNWSKVPVVLIEMGFLSNIEEDKLLSSSDYQNKIAESLAKGIKKTLGN